MNTKVSVIIPTWNSGKVLSQCLDSLAKQTIKDFEIILIDNGSSDNAIVNLPEKWPAFDFQIKELGRNVEFAAANNGGAHLARGHDLANLIA